MNDFTKMIKEFLSNYDGPLSKEDERILAKRSDEAMDRGNFISDKETRAMINRILKNEGED